MYEAVLFLDESAGEAIAAAAAFVVAHGLQVTHRAPFSVAFVEAGLAGPTGGAGEPPARADRAGRDVLPAGAGQIAAVPVQVRPEWSRVWVMAAGEGEAVRVAAAYVARERARSERIAAAVHALEASALSPARWPEVEAGLRANLRRQGLDEATIETRVTAFRQRWLALSRAAAKAPPEEPAP